MKEIALQKVPKCSHCGSSMRSFSEEDENVWQEYTDNQIIKSKTTGVKKPRSWKQLKLFWVCCRKVADNARDENWDNENKVANQVKIKLQFIDMNKSVFVDGKFYPHFRSISFKNLPHMAACRFFDRAFEVMAKYLGITTDKLLENAK